MDLIWSIFCGILICMIPFCCAFLVCCAYWTTTCKCNPSKVLLLAIVLHLLTTTPVTMGQVSLTSQSFYPCNYNDRANTMLTCNQNGVLTRFDLNISLSVTNSSVIVYEIPWTAVAADVTGKSQVLSSANSCAGHTDCNIIKNNTKITLRVIPTQITHNLIRVFPFVPYTYFFGTFDASINASLTDPNLLLVGPGTCAGAPANYISSVCSAFKPLDVDIQPMIQSGQLCGNNFDSIANTSYVKRVVNSQDYCQGAVCGDCPANGIPAPTLAASFPALPYCSIFKISAVPYLTAAVEIIISNDNITDTYSIFLKTNNGRTVSMSGRRNFVRGLLNAINLEGPSVPYDIGQALNGYIVVCGIDKSESTFQQLILGAKNPLQGVVGGVPTANGMNSTVSWYYISADKYAREYGTQCDQNGNAGGMGDNLYNSANALNAACSSLQVGGTPLDGLCVPGTTYSTVKTPCQVASILNDFSQDYKSAYNNGSTTPPVPEYLPPKYSPNFPNYHIFKIGKGLYLSKFPTGRTNYPLLRMQSTFDVSEQLVQYSKHIPNAIVSISQSSCFYNAQTQTGLLSIMLCNVGSTSGDFIVTVESVGAPFGYNTSIIILDTTLPDSQQVNDLSNIEGHRCRFLPKSYSFTLNTTSGFLENNTLPIFIGNVTYTITDSTGTVQMGLLQNPVISCDAYPGNGTIAVAVSYNQTVYSCPSLGAAFGFQAGCTPFSIILYVSIVTIFVLIILVIAFACMDSSEKKKVKEIQHQDNDLYKTNEAQPNKSSHGYYAVNLRRRKTSLLQQIQ